MAFALTRFMNIYYRIIIFIISIFFVLYLSCNTKKNDIKDFSKIEYPDSLKIILQKDWGGTAEKHKADFHRIEKITLHHGGVEFKEDKDPQEYLRNLQNWSRSEKKWIDIPYHFLIDLNGKVYEGRSLQYPGDTNTNYNPHGHLLICLMGNYEIQVVNSEQIKSLVDLLVFFCANYKINPDLIKGHKDYAETACPGKDFYNYIVDGSLNNKVSAKLNQTSVKREDE